MVWTPADLSPHVWLHPGSDVSLRDTGGGSGYTGVLSGAGTPNGSWAVERWGATGGRYADQAETTWQPLVLPAELRGLPALRFDGANDFLACPIARFGSALAQPDTIWLVCRWRGATAAGYYSTIFDEDLAAVGYRQNLWYYVDFGDWTFSAGANVRMTGLDLSEWGLLVIAFDGTSSTWQHNGGTVSAGAAAGAYAMDSYRLGSNAGNTWASDVDIAEIGIVSGVMSSGDRASLWSYVSDTYLVPTVVTSYVPDAIAASTNVTGAVAAVQTAGGDRLSATVPANNLDVRFSFPTPS